MAVECKIVLSAGNWNTTTWHTRETTKLTHIAFLLRVHFSGEPWPNTDWTTPLRIHIVGGVTFAHPDEAIPQRSRATTPNSATRISLHHKSPLLPFWFAYVPSYNWSYLPKGIVSFRHVPPAIRLFYTASRSNSRDGVKIAPPTHTSKKHRGR